MLTVTRNFSKMALYRLPGVHLYALPRVHRRAERIFRREIDDVLLYYSDEELVGRYRFGRQTIRDITRLVEDQISPATSRSQPVSARLDKSTVCRIIRRGTVALSRRID